MKGAGEEASLLGAACGVWASWLSEAPEVAQEGSVTKYVTATTDMHSMSEVT